MRFAVAVCCALLFVAGGCSGKFAGEWIEEGKLARDGTFTPAEGPRRMALKFDPIATVRAGAYLDGAGVVDAQVLTSTTYFIMKDGTVAQFGATIAKCDGKTMTTFVDAEESRRFKRVKGPSIFPPQVYLKSLEGG